MNCDPLARWYRTLEYLGMGRALERRRFEFLPLLSKEVGRPLRGLPCRSTEDASCQAALGGAPANHGGGRSFDSLRLAQDDRRKEAADFSRASQESDNDPNQSGQASEKPLSLAALLLGDGDGRFLVALLEVNLTLQVDYVDSSARMLALARARVIRCLGQQAAENRVRFFQADALQWQPPTGRAYGLVVTHFFLDCLTDGQVRTLLERLEPCLARDAIWIVSEFRQPPRGLAAWRARLWIGGLYRAFGWLTGLRTRRLPDHRTALARHGFRLEREIVAEWGLLVSEWWQRPGPDFAFDAPGRAPLHSPTPKS